MISSPLSHDERAELVRGAHANVGLIADGIWAPGDEDEDDEDDEEEDTYRRSNRALWIRVSARARTRTRERVGRH